MALTREIYTMAERLTSLDPDRARRLKKTAVTVPARVAGAAGTAGPERLEHVAAARTALAELSREALDTGEADDAELARRADALDRAVLFEFGAPGVFS
jgi:hypothetical protein